MIRALEIYTYGGGEALTNLFHGIVGIIGDDSFITLVKLAGAVGLAWVLLIVAFKPDNFTQVGKWFVGYVVIFNALLVPKIDIAIVDRLNPGLQRNIIQNVPWGLGYFAHIASHIGDGTTRLIEKNFALPNDLKYQKYGTVMASSLVAKASGFRITDPDMAANIREFMQQCVFYDLLLGKYTLKAIFETHDIWSFVKTNASPARSFRYHSQIKTCQEGALALEQDWKMEIQNAADVYGKRFFPNQANSKQALLSALPASYQYLTHVSEGAGQLLRQNMMMNALQEGIISNGATADATAAIQNFAVSRAEQQQRTAYAITGELAGRWLPIMKNVFEALFYGAFPFVFLIVLLPAGIGVLKTYLMSLFWIQSWAPLYAILNLLMHIDAKTNSIAASSLGNNHVLSLANASGIAQVNNDTAILAGYLSMAIPFIAFGIIKGGAYTFTHLAGYIGGVSQASATQASEEATTGNISLSNTSMSNHNFNNMSAHKQDLNADTRAGVFSHQAPSGATITSTSGGTQSISSGPAISSTGLQLQASESFKASAMQQSEHYTQVAEQSAQESASSLTNAYRNLYELGKHQSQHTSSGEHYSTGESAMINKELSEGVQLVERFAKDTGLATDQAVSVLGSMTAQAGTPGFLKNISPVNLQTQAGLEGVSQAKATEIFDQAQSFVESNNLSEKFDHLSKAVSDQSYHTGTEQGDRIVENIGASLDRAESTREIASQSLQRADTYRELSALSQEKSESINAITTQDFVDWFKKQPALDGEGKMGIDGVEDILHNRPELAMQYGKEFIDERTQQFMDDFAEKHGFLDEQAIASKWQPDNQSTVIESQYDSMVDNLNEQAKSQGLDFNNATDDSVKREATNRFKNIEQRIEDGTQSSNQTGSERKEEVAQNVNEKKDHLAYEAVSNVGEKVSDTAKEYWKKITD